jgi:crotonobetaine/carnitine-CoA ligase
MLKLRQITPQDNLYTCLPLFHGNAKLLTVVPAITAGCRVSVGVRFSVSGFWDEVRACGATQINYLGVMIAMLHAQTPANDDRSHSVRLGWGAGAPAAIHRSFEERFGMRLLEGFGLTEGGIPLSNTLSENRPGSCGKPLPGYDCDVVDEWDNPVPAGKEGEIVFRPLRPYTTMLGYYNMPEKTVEIYRNCMLHTGDLARKDEDGFFFFVDRKKDAIRRRGENISSFEVEAAINAHPKVLESAAFAVPSDVSEDDVMAVIVLREGQTATAEELADHCIENMPYFWVPRYLRITHEGLPRTPTNKVTKFTLREQGIASAGWDRQKAAYRLDAPRTPKRAART